VADAGLGGEGNDLAGFDTQGFGERGQRFAQLIVGDAIGLGGDDEESPIMMAEPVEKLNVGGLGRDGDIHQRKAEGERGARLEIGIDETRPLHGELFGSAGVAVAGEIDKEHLGVRPAGTAQVEEVDGLGASGGVAGLGDLRSDEGVDEARFADIGAAEEGDLRRAGCGELPGVGGGGDELGEELHDFSVAGAGGKSKERFICALRSRGSLRASLRQRGRGLFQFCFRGLTPTARTNARPSGSLLPVNFESQVGAQKKGANPSTGSGQALGHLPSAEWNGTLSFSSPHG